MSVIFWDTNLFIYLIEEAPHLSSKVISFRKEMLDNQDQLVTSTLTLGEVLVRPYKEKRIDLVEHYTRTLKSPDIILVDFDVLVADRFAKIRAKYRQIKPPDAIQLACASTYGVDLFVTNDERFSNLQVEDVHSIKSLSQVS